MAVILVGIASPSGPGGMWAALLAGCAIAAVIWMFGYTAGGGLDGPCLGSLARSSDEGAQVSHEPTVAPPGARCTVYAPDGRLIRSETYPGLVTWLLVLIAFVIPWAIWFRRRAAAT